MLIPLTTALAHLHSDTCKLVLREKFFALRTRRAWLLSRRGKAHAFSVPSSVVTSNRESLLPLRTSLTAARGRPTRA